jgi:hypothetical protein
MRCADCQVPQVTARATEATTPEALFELFRDWQRTQTQSSATALISPRQQMDVRFCTMQEPPAERQTCAAIDPDQPSTRSLERAKRTRAPLFTTDLHGRRSLARESDASRICHNSSYGDTAIGFRARLYSRCGIVCNCSFRCLCFKAGRSSGSTISIGSRGPNG